MKNAEIPTTTNESYLLKIDTDTWWVVMPATEDAPAEVQPIERKVAHELIDEGWEYTSNIARHDVARDLAGARLAEYREKMRAAREVAA